LHFGTGGERAPRRARHLVRGSVARSLAPRPTVHADRRRYGPTRSCRAIIRRRRSGLAARWRWEGLLRGARHTLIEIATQRSDRAPARSTVSTRVRSGTTAQSRDSTERHETAE